jgi:heme o synthase
VSLNTLVLPLVSSRLGDYLQLTKPRLNLLVVFTTAGGYWLGVAGHVDAGLLLHTVVGTALVAGGSAALNQLYERDVDALMTRTRTRPLPDGRLSPLAAF